MGCNQILEILRALLSSCLSGEGYFENGQNQNQNQNQNQYPLQDQNQYQQYPNQQYPNQQYPNQQYPNQQYPNQQYPNQQYPNQQYPNQQYPNQQYPNQQYPNQQYPSYSQAAGADNNNDGKQQYQQPVNNEKPTQDELNNLALALEKIIRIDSNKFIPGTDIKINPQRSIRVGESGDHASQHLFNYVNMDKLRSTPTIKLFFDLLDNYTPELGVTETINQQEKKEINKFIDEICKTAPMKYCLNYLASKKKVSNDLSKFKTELYNIWFRGYYRKAVNDTSAFEHVFVGEVKEDNDGVIGFHNWITIYKEEQKGNFDYRGWIPPRKDAKTNEKPDQDSFALSIKFDWKGIEKPVTSCLIGTSPECEVAMYTLMYYLSDEVEIKYDDYAIKFIMHTFNNKNGKTIGSCYPELV
jgi:poly(U)-specific endoribonuclease